MNRLFPFILLAALLAACAENTSEPKAELSETDTSCVNPSSLNPNGDSEMALIMREMTVFTEKTKELLLGKGSLLPYPAHFKGMLTANTTDSTINKAVLAGFSNDFLGKLKALYDSPAADQAKQFNLLVNSCITCHENFCHGPIKRISKMLIPG
ncbi:MAG: hypothetical protein AB1458_07330 [Bacteroidota bacterium]